MRVRFNPETQDCEVLDEVDGRTWTPLRSVDAPGDYCAFEIPAGAPSSVPTPERLYAWCETFDGIPTEDWLYKVITGEITVDNFNRAVLAGTAPEGL